jgi:hypothetical protein
MTAHDAAIALHIRAIKEICAALDPDGKIQVTRTEALEWWDKARITNKRRNADEIQKEAGCD